MLSVLGSSLLMCALGGTPTVVEQARTPSPRGSVDVFAAPTLPVVSLHQPVLAGVLIRNRGNSPVVGDLGFNYKGKVALVVTMPDGSRTLPLRLRRGLGIAAVGRVALEPGEEWCGTLILNDWLTFDDVGTYEVGLNIEGEFKTDSGARVDVSIGDPMTIEIKPRDQRMLRRTCAHLATVIVWERRVSQIVLAAEALAYMDDPVGVECMNVVFPQTNRADGRLINGLIRIRSPEARRLLERLAAGIGERAVRAQGALERIRWEENRAWETAQQAP